MNCVVVVFLFFSFCYRSMGGNENNVSNFPLRLEKTNNNKKKQPVQKNKRKSREIHISVPFYGIYTYTYLDIYRDSNVRYDAKLFMKVFCGLDDYNCKISNVCSVIVSTIWRYFNKNNCASNNKKKGMKWKLYSFYIVAFWKCFSVYWFTHSP